MTVIWKRGSTAAALLATTMLFSAQAIAQGVDTSIENLKREISEIESSIASFGKPDSLIGILMQSRLDTTKLTLALMVNKRLAENGAGTVEIVVPAVQPNPNMAEEILNDILAQQDVIKKAEAEAANSGGLVQAVAMSRVQTEKLLLSQLNAAWYQAKYGISLPMFTPPDRNKEAQIASAPQSDGGSDNAVWTCHVLVPLRFLIYAA